jgi:hypothetical protein
VVKDLCGVQAQEAPAAALAIRARSSGLTAADVERARVHAERRSVVRTWAMRGTLHLLAAEDLGWLLPLLGPVFIRESKRRYAQLGLDEETCARAIRAMREMLGSQGELTRAELAGQLKAKGIPTEGQAAPHLLRRAALEGVLCLGSDHGSKATYVLLEDWVGVRETLGVWEDPKRLGAAQVELARRYLEAYAPAGPEDLAAWSGLSVRDARSAFAALEGQLIEVEAAGASAWMLTSQAAWLDDLPRDGDVVRLLPAFDPYLLGYRSRDLVVPQSHARRIHPGGGVLRPTLLVNGRAAGTWKTKRSRGSLSLVVEPFESLGPEVTRGLEEEAEDLGRFLGLNIALNLASPD